MWNYLKLKNKPIVLYGMGNGAQKIIDTLKTYGLSPVGVFASDDFVRYQNFSGFTVKKYSELVKEFPDMIVLVSFGTQRDEVLDNIKKIAKTSEVLVPDVPVYGDGLFTVEYAREHKKELEQVYNLLADEQSKTCFENCVRYRISGKPEYLYECETPISEAYENILKLTSSEVFYDLGAYTGDTLTQFLEHTGGAKEIHAFEPDRKNFKKLEKNFGDTADVYLHNCAVSNECGEISFAQNGGRNSYIDKNGEKTPSVSLDLLDITPPTFINFDVEGQELEAIEGAKNIIKVHKPKMLISAYHKTDDYTEIVKKVLSIRDDYKVYMRHYKYLPAWDTAFYFV